MQKECWFANVSSFISYKSDIKCFFVVFMITLFIHIYISPDSVNTFSLMIRNVFIFLSWGIFFYFFVFLLPYRVCVINEGRKSRMRADSFSAMPLNRENNVSGRKTSWNLWAISRVYTDQWSVASSLFCHSLQSILMSDCSFILPGTRSTRFHFHLRDYSLILYTFDTLPLCLYNIQIKFTPQAIFSI